MAKRITLYKDAIRAGIKKVQARKKTMKDSDKISQGGANLLKAELEEDSVAIFPVDLSSHENFIKSMLGAAEDTGLIWHKFIFMAEHSTTELQVFCKGDFAKNVTKHDANVREKAEEAIREIVADPSGESYSWVKPLGASYKNQYRYRLRIGFRVIYEYSKNNRRLILLDFLPRENLYRDKKRS